MAGFAGVLVLEISPWANEEFIQLVIPRSDFGSLRLKQPWVLGLKRRLPQIGCADRFSWGSVGPGKDGYGPRTDIAAMQGRVLASAELGNGPGVDACTAPYSADAGIGATLSTNF
jgi:hypothetical protein